MHLSIKSRPPRSEALSLIHQALDRNVTFFDTADAYCIGEGDKHHNEKLLAEALDLYRGDATDAIIATKGGLVRPGGRWERNGDPEHLRRTIRESYEILGPIQLWQHHAPDENVPVTESIQAAKQAQDEGLIRWIGVSNYSVDQLEAVRKIVDVVSLQNQCSLWHRRPVQNGEIEYCEENEITFLPWRPLGGSKKAKQIKNEPVLKNLARKKGASPHQIALAWLMEQASVVLPIPGVTRKETLADSLKAIQIDLSPDEIDEISRTVGG